MTSAIATRAQQEAGAETARSAGAYHDSEDLIQLGAYVSGTNPELDASIRLRPEVLDFLRQHHQERCPLEETLGKLQDLASHLSAQPAAVNTRR